MLKCFYRMYILNIYDVLKCFFLVVCICLNTYFSDVTISRNKTSNGIDVILVVSEVINLSVSIETSSDLINILVMVGEQSLKGKFN